MRFLLFYFSATGVYSVIVFLLALAILIKSPKNSISRFYAFCVLLLISFGTINYSYINFASGKSETSFLFMLIVLLYSLFPFLFLHFIIVFVGFSDFLKSKFLLSSIYFVAIFSYAMILLGWIPIQGISKGNYSINLHIFYLIWLSIFFGLGIVHLYSLYGGFVDKGRKSNLILSGFSLLLFILPGPFSESVLQVIIGQKVEMYFFSSILALIISVYLVFRHKSIVTITDTLKSVMEVITDVIIKTDDKLNIELVKGSVFELLGYEEKEIISRDFKEFVQNKNELSSFIFRLIDSTNDAKDIDLEIITKDSKTVKMNFSVSTFREKDVVTGFACIGREVTVKHSPDSNFQRVYEELEKSVQEKTAALAKANNELIIENMERKRVEKALFESQERFRKSFEDAPIGMALLSLDGFFLRVNHSFTELLSYSEIELLKKRYIDLTYSEDRKQSETLLNDILNDKISTYKIEQRFVRKDGTYVWTHTSSSVIKDEIELKPVYLIIQIQDITERKKAEEELKKYSEELKELNSSKDKFFSILAHDLKAPLHGLLGYAKILKEEKDNLEKNEISEFSASIYQLSKNIYELINNLLEWSRLQTNRIEINLSSINLKTKTTEILELLQGNAHNKGIKISNTVEENLFVVTDGKILGSILQNLISNSIKFTNPGGEILIKSGFSNGFVEISVEDNGIGIEPEKIKKLFKIDTNFSTEGTKGEIGTGLGLILCKEFVDKLGGNISVQSELGKGSTFSFSLPKEN
jgi:PAS domain S-box-containing protein